VTFDVTIDTTDRVIAAVREGRADIGLAFYPPVESDLTTAFKVREPLVAVMSADHPLARRDRISLADSMSYPIALPMRHSGARMLIDIACKAAGIQLTPSLETNSIQLRVRFIYASLGITFLTRLTVWDGVRSGDLVAVSLKDRIVNSASIDAVTLSTRHLPIAAEEFVHLLQRELESLKESPRKQPRGSRQ
jgi:DNA-binding transcriptional LysR family regulator